MLGPPVEEHRGNKWVMVAVGAILVLFGYPFIMPTEKPNVTGAAIVAAIAALIIGWLWSVKVTLHQDGITYQSWFANKEMRWEDVDRFYFSSVRRSINFIPIGTYYTFKLVDTLDQKISFGNQVERPGVLAEKLIRLTYGPLIKKIAQAFDSGKEIDFGGIRVSRQNGLRVKKSRWGGLTHKFVVIPWNHVSSYDIQKGHFYVWRVGEKRTTGPALSQVPNAFVLKGLLDAIFPAKPSA